MLHPRFGPQSGDPTLLEPTTNLFLSQLPKSCCEATLVEMFGKWGKIAHVKVMHPRTEYDKARGIVSAFVAFTTRAGAESAKTHFDGFEYDGVRMKLGWGRAITKAQVDNVERLFGENILLGEALVKKLIENDGRALVEHLGHLLDSILLRVCWCSYFEFPLCQEFLKSQANSWMI